MEKFIKYDQWGNILSEKDKFSNPYDYDPFMVGRTDSKKKVNACIYSDRLFRYDSEKHDALCRKHFGDESQYWNERDLSKIQDFLREYLQDSTLELVNVIEMCNPSSGFPYWQLNYWTKKRQSSPFSL